MSDSRIVEKIVVRDPQFLQYLSPVLSIISIVYLSAVLYWHWGGLSTPLEDLEKIKKMEELHADIISQRTRAQLELSKLVAAKENEEQIKALERLNVELSRSRIETQKIESELATFRKQAQYRIAEKISNLDKKNNKQKEEGKEEEDK